MKFMNSSVFDALEQLLRFFASGPLGPDQHIEDMFITTFKDWVGEQLDYFEPDWAEYLPNISEEKAIELATKELLNIFNTDKKTLLETEHPLPLVGNTEEVEDGWEINLLFGEEYCFEVGIDGSCNLQGFSCSDSKFGNWYYPDARFNPPEGHPPAMDRQY